MQLSYTPLHLPPGAGAFAKADAESLVTTLSVASKKMSVQSFLMSFDLLFMLLSFHGSSYEESLRSLVLCS